MAFVAVFFVVSHDAKSARTQQPDQLHFPEGTVKEKYRWLVRLQLSNSSLRSLL